MNRNIDQIWRDIGLIVLSIFLTINLVKTGAINEIIAYTHEFLFLDSFIAGFFFTSAFTTAPSIAILGTIAQTTPPWIVALFGGLGALCGDLIIFRFMRNRIRDDLSYLLRNTPNKRIRMLFKLRLFRWFTFFLGALIIASPLPDELGIFLLGITKTRITSFAILSFLFNSLGILAIGLIARAL